MKVTPLTKGANVLDNPYKSTPKANKKPKSVTESFAAILARYKKV